jgi:2-methylcitrate dehydratase PrpD
MLRSERIAAADIESMVMRFPRAGAHCVDGNPLKSHCAQYVLPVAAVNGSLEVADIFLDRRETNSKIAALSRRVEVSTDDELDKLFPDFYATKLEITTKDGRRIERRNDIARGYPESPMSQVELDAKFGSLVGSVHPRAVVNQLAAALQALPQAERLKGFAGLLCLPVRGS